MDWCSGEPGGKSVGSRWARGAVCEEGLLRRVVLVVARRDDGHVVGGTGDGGQDAGGDRGGGGFVGEVVISPGCRDMLVRGGGHHGDIRGASEGCERAVEDVQEVAGEHF